jgi:hypothetical protein
MRGRMVGAMKDTVGLPEFGMVCQPSAIDENINRSFLEEALNFVFPLTNKGPRHDDEVREGGYVSGILQVWHIPFNEVRIR